MRKALSRARSQKRFRNGYNTVKKINFAGNVMRGGIRL